jgi:hypothetical protein
MQFSDASQHTDIVLTEAFRQLDRITDPLTAALRTAQAAFDAAGETLQQQNAAFVLSKQQLLDAKADAQYTVLLSRHIFSRVAPDNQGTDYARRTTDFKARICRAEHVQRKPCSETCLLRFCSDSMDQVAKTLWFLKPDEPDVPDTARTIRAEMDRYADAVGRGVEPDAAFQEFKTKLLASAPDLRYRKDERRLVSIFSVLQRVNVKKVAEPVQAFRQAPGRALAGKGVARFGELYAQQARTIGSAATPACNGSSTAAAKKRCSTSSASELPQPKRVASSSSSSSSEMSKEGSMEVSLVKVATSQAEMNRQLLIALARIGGHRFPSYLKHVPPGT